MQRKDLRKNQQACLSSFFLAAAVMRFNLNNNQFNLIPNFCSDPNISVGSFINLLYQIPEITTTDKNKFEKKIRGERITEREAVSVSFKTPNGAEADICRMYRIKKFIFCSYILC